MIIAYAVWGFPRSRAATEEARWCSGLYWRARTQADTARADLEPPVGVHGGGVSARSCGELRRAGALP